MFRTLQILICVCLFSCEKKQTYFNRLDVFGTPKTIITTREDVNGIDTLRISNIYMKSMTVNTWDNKGKILTSQFFPFDLANKKFSLGYTDKFKYDDRNFISFEETYDNQGKLTHKFQHTKHNNTGLPIETKLVQGEAVDSIVTTYFIDKIVTNEFDDGKRIAEQLTNFNGEFIESSILTYFSEIEGDVIKYTENYKYYTFDKKGNWTKRLIIENESNCPCYLESRILEY